MGDDFALKELYRKMVFEVEMGKGVLRQQTAPRR
jgi:hypothetical protein